jgi:hypothetical protein
MIAEGSLFRHDLIVLVVTSRPVWRRGSVSRSVGIAVSPDRPPSRRDQRVTWLGWHSGESLPRLIQSIVQPDAPDLAFPVWLYGVSGNMNSGSLQDAMDTYTGMRVAFPMYPSGGRGAGHGHQPRRRREGRRTGNVPPDA